MIHSFVILLLGGKMGYFEYLNLLMSTHSWFGWADFQCSLAPKMTLTEPIDWTGHK